MSPLGLFCIFFILSAIYYVLSRKKKRMPGPSFITDIFCGTKITEDAKQHLYLHYLYLSRMFGPIFQVDLDGKRTVVVTDPDIAHSALVGKPDDFAGRPQDTMFKNSNQETNDLGTSPYNERFRLIKKAAGKALWGYMSGDNLEKRVQFVCQQLSQLWMGEKGVFDPCKELAYPGVGVCLGAMFNTDYSPDDLDYQYVRENMEAFVSLDTTGGGATDNLLKQVGDEYPQFMRRKIDKVAEKFCDNTEQAESIVEHLLVEQRENEDARVRQYLKDNMQYLLTDLMGGNITVHSTLIWTIFFMAKYQDVQENVYREILRVIGTTSPIGLHHRRQMPYTQAVLMEVMRRGTITPIGFPHTTTADTRLAEYDIPKNTDVTFHFYAFHHDHASFEHPETFNPDRFLRHDVTGDVIIKPRAFMPFSAGRRKCPAEMVAKPEVFMILCHVIRTWEVLFPQGESYPENYASSRYSVSGLPGHFKIQPKLRDFYDD